MLPGGAHRATDGDQRRPAIERDCSWPNWLLCLRLDGLVKYLRLLQPSVVWPVQWAIEKQLIRGDNFQTSFRVVGLQS